LTGAAEHRAQTNASGSASRMRYSAGVTGPSSLSWTKMPADANHITPSSSTKRYLVIAREANAPLTCECKSKR